MWETNERLIEIIQGMRPVLIFFAIHQSREFALKTIHLKNQEREQMGSALPWAAHVQQAFDSQKWFTDRGLTRLEGMLAFLEKCACTRTLRVGAFPAPQDPESPPSMAAHAARYS